MGACLIPNCTSTVRGYGLCGYHYNEAYEMIADGVAAKAIPSFDHGWDVLISQGLALSDETGLTAPGAYQIDAEGNLELLPMASPETLKEFAWVDEWRAAKLKGAV